MKSIKEELKKQLVAYLNEWLWEETEDEYGRVSTEEIVDNILNPEMFPHIAVVDKDAKFFPDEVFVVLQQQGWVKEVGE